MHDWSVGFLRCPFCHDPSIATILGGDARRCCCTEYRITAHGRAAFHSVVSRASMARRQCECPESVDRSRGRSNIPYMTCKTEQWSDGRQVRTCSCYSMDRNSSAPFGEKTRDCHDCGLAVSAQMAINALVSFRCGTCMIYESSTWVLC